jgi:hypothetical protein
MVKDITSAVSFGDHLRELRGALTQQALARRSVAGQEALTRQRVSYIENGRVPTASQLCCYLRGCGRDDLVEELEVVRRQLQAAGQAAITGSSWKLWNRWRFGVVGLTAAAVVLVAVVLVAAFAFNRPPVVVVPAVGECAPNYVCFWSEPNFAGDKIQRDPVWYSANHCVTLPFEARSEMNSSKERQLGFRTQDCAGQPDVLDHLGNSMRSMSARSYRHS